jgi:hypothetical protein
MFAKWLERIRKKGQLTWLTLAGSNFLQGIESLAKNYRCTYQIFLGLDALKMKKFFILF